MIQINRDPSKKDLFSFGLMLVAFVALLGFLMMSWWGLSVEVAKWTWIVGGALSIAYWAVPPLRAKIFVGWMLAAYPIGWTVSHVLMGAIYYLVMTPIGVAMRTFGTDPMSRKLERDASSYWLDRERVTDKNRYFKQF